MPLAWAASSTASGTVPAAAASAVLPSAPASVPLSASTHAAASAAASPASSASASEPGFAPVAQGQTFTIRIEAPEDIRTFVDRYLELHKYQKVSDLDAVELQRLLDLSDTNIRQLLGTQGYFTPTITQKLEPASATPPAASASAPAAALPEVHITIDPGPKTTIGAVDLGFAGAIASAPTAARQLASARTRWSLPTGSPFTQTAWSTAKAETLQRLQNRRFPTARLVQSRAEVDPDTHTAHLVVDYDSGPLYRYGPLRIQGAQRYDPKIIERLVRLPVGSEYRQRDLLDAQQRLLDSGYYNSAFVTLDTDAHTDPAAAPVTAQVREAKLQRVVLGVGVSTDRGPGVTMDHTHNQLPGLGWRALTKLEVDKKLQTFSTSLLSPPDDGLWHWMTNATASHEHLTDHTQTTQQLKFGRTKTDREIDRTVYLAYDRSKADYTDGSRINAQALSANFIWTYRRFNSTTFPTRGYGVGIEIGGGMTLHPRRIPFTRVVGRYLGFLSLDDSLGQGLRDALPLPSQIKAAATGQAAAASDASDDLQRQAAAALRQRQRRNGELVFRIEGAGVYTKSDAVIPPNLLFLAGGDTTVRGYGYQELGVANANGIVVPGRYLVTGSVEYRRPIFRAGKRTSWDSVAYVDAGAVADAPSGLHPLRIGIGTGALYRSPVGPIQMSVAYGLYTHKLRLHLNLGFTF